MKRLLLTASCCCLLLPALGGCAVWHRLAGYGRDLGMASLQVRVRPAPAPDLIAPDPAAVVDRLYARAAEAIRARDYALALDMLQVAAARAPGDVRVLNAQAVVYDKLGRFDLSGRYYARALVADPNSTIVANNIVYSARLHGLGIGSSPLQAAVPAPVRAPVPAAAAAPAPALMRASISAAAAPSSALSPLEALSAPPSS